MNIRAFLPSDQKSAYEIAKQTPEGWSLQAFDHCWQAPYCSLVGEWQGDLLGFIVLWQAEDRLEILNIAVDIAHQRQGYAKQLLQKAIDYFKQQSLRVLQLEVRSSNWAARNLYEQLGFQVVGVRPGYYLKAGTLREDAILYDFSPLFYENS